MRPILPFTATATCSCGHVVALERAARSLPEMQVAISEWRLAFQEHCAGCSFARSTLASEEETRLAYNLTAAFSAAFSNGFTRIGRA